MNLVELNRRLEKTDNRFELCIRAARLARKARKLSMGTEGARNPAIEVLEDLAARLGDGPQPREDQ